MTRHTSRPRAPSASHPSDRASRIAGSSFAIGACSAALLTAGFALVLQPHAALATTPSGLQGVALLVTLLSGLFTCAAFATLHSFDRDGPPTSGRRAPAPAVVRRLPVLLVALCACSIAVGDARSQTPAQDSASAPEIRLSTAQRATIFQSISRTQRNQAAPPGFRVSVGATTPPAIEVHPLPQTLVELIPEADRFRAAMIDGNVVMIDTSSSRFAAVIAKDEF